MLASQRNSSSKWVLIRKLLSLLVSPRVSLPTSPLVFPQAAVLPFTPDFAVVPGRDGAQGLSAVVEGFVSAPPTSHSPKDPVARGARETLSTVTKAKTLRLTYCPQNN